MLKDEDRIFKNLYNDLGADIISGPRSLYRLVKILSSSLSIFNI